jgi:hypothetical protein
VKEAIGKHQRDSSKKKVMAHKKSRSRSRNPSENAPSSIVSSLNSNVNGLESKKKDIMKNINLDI